MLEKILFPMSICALTFSIGCGAEGELGTSSTAEISAISEGASYLMVSDEDDTAAEDGVAGMDDQSIDDMASEISDDELAPEIRDEDATPCDFRSRQTRVRAEFDVNGNGALEREEIEALRATIEDREARHPRLQRLVRRHRHRVFHRIRWAFDANNDGTLDQDERRAFVVAMQARCEERRQARLDAFDTNGDGTIDREELQAARQARIDAMQERRDDLLERYDANEDGRLDREERQTWRADMADRFRARRQAVLEQFDADGDGALNEEELAALKAAIRNRT